MAYLMPHHPTRHGQTAIKYTSRAKLGANTKKERIKMSEQDTINIAVRFDENTEAKLIKLSDLLGISKSDVVKTAITRLFTMPARWDKPSTDLMGDKPRVGNYNVRLTGIYVEWVEIMKAGIERNLQNVIVSTGSSLSWRTTTTDVITQAIITMHQDAVSGIISRSGAVKEYQ